MNHRKGYLGIGNVPMVIHFVFLKDRVGLDTFPDGLELHSRNNEGPILTTYDSWDDPPSGAGDPPKTHFRSLKIFPHSWKNSDRRHAKRYLLTIF